MTAPVSLYPEATYTEGQGVILRIELEVPNSYMHITIQQVHLTGSKVSMFCDIREREGPGCWGATTTNAKVGIQLPLDIDKKELTLHRYVLDHTSTVALPAYKNFKFVNSKKEYEELISL